MEGIALVNPFWVSEVLLAWAGLMLGRANIHEYIVSKVARPVYL